MPSNWACNHEFRIFLHFKSFVIWLKLTSRNLLVAGLIDERSGKSRLLRRALSIELLMSRERKLVAARVETLPPDLQGARLREAVQHVDGVLAQRRRRRRARQLVLLAVGSPGAVVAGPRAPHPPTAARSLHHQQQTQHQHDGCSHASRECTSDVTQRDRLGEEIFLMRTRSSCVHRVRDLRTLKLAKNDKIQSRSSAIL